MTFKLLLTGMALAAIAFAVPASVSASELYDVVTEEAPAENAEFETTGMSNFDIGFGHHMQP